MALLLPIYMTLARFFAKSIRNKENGNLSMPDSIFHRSSQITFHKNKNYAIEFYAGSISPMPGLYLSYLRSWWWLHATYICMESCSCLRHANLKCHKLEKKGDDDLDNNYKELVIAYFLLLDVRSYQCFQL